MKKETCFTDASCPLSDARILNKVITSAPEVVKYIQENYYKIKMHEDLVQFAKHIFNADYPNHTRFGELQNIAGQLLKMAEKL